MSNLVLAQLNFLEAIGALTLIGGAFYLYLNNLENKEKELKYYKWLLDNDFIARDEFTDKYKHLRFGSSDYEYNKCLKDFFTEEKLAEVNKRLEKKEGTSK